MKPPPSNEPAPRPLPARELFAGSGMPEEVLIEQERMDNLFAVHFRKPGLDQPAWVDCSDWQDEDGEV